MLKAKLKLDAFELASALTEEIDEAIESQEEFEQMTIDTKIAISSLVFSVLERELLKINELDMVAR